MSIIGEAEITPQAQEFHSAVVGDPAISNSAPIVARFRAGMQINKIVEDSLTTHIQYTSLTKTVKNLVKAVQELQVDQTATWGDLEDGLKAIDDVLCSGPDNVLTRLAATEKSIREEQQAHAAIDLRNILDHAQALLALRLGLVKGGISGRAAEKASRSWRDSIALVPHFDRVAFVTTQIQRRIAAGVDGASELEILLQSEPRALDALVGLSEVREVGDMAAHGDRLPTARYERAIQVYDHSGDVECGREGFRALLRFVRRA